MSKELIVYGKAVLLDNDDYERLHEYTWCLAHMNGVPYAVRSIKRKRQYMHHDVIGKPPKGLVTDHINRDTLDNRKENLRHVTYAENNRNRQKLPNAFVHFEKGVYRARPYIGEERFNAGRFKTKEEAIAAVKAFFDAK